MNGIDLGATEPPVTQPIDITLLMNKGPGDVGGAAATEGEET